MDPERNVRRVPMLDLQKRVSGVRLQIRAVEQPRSQDDCIDHTRKNDRHENGCKALPPPQISEHLQKQWQNEQHGHDRDRRVDRSAQRIQGGKDEKTGAVNQAQPVGCPHHQPVIDHGQDQGDAEHLQTLDPIHEARLRQGDDRTGHRKGHTETQGPIEEVRVRERCEDDSPSQHFE